MSSWLLSTNSSKSLLLFRAQRNLVFHVGGSGLSTPSLYFPLNMAQACNNHCIDEFTLPLHKSWAFRRTASSFFIYSDIVAGLILYASTVFEMPLYELQCKKTGGDGSDLEECSILLSVVVLFACVFPRNPKDGFFFVFPNQTWIFPAVDLINQPLPQFAISTADWQAAIFFQVHPCKNPTYSKDKMESF